MKITILFLIACSCFGAARTASVTGNWSSTTTWGGLSVPGNGDTITINLGITLTVNDARIIGTSPADCTGTQAIQNNSGTLTVGTGGTLTLRGCATLAGTGQLAITGTGHFQFDASTAGSPSTTHYLVTIGAANNDTALVSLAGTNSSSRCLVDSNASGGNGSFTDGGFNRGGMIQSNQCALQRIGTASISAANFNPTSGSDIFYLKNGTCDTCGLINQTGFQANGATITFDGVTFSNSLNTYTLSVGGFTPTVGVTITNSVFDKQVYLFTPYNDVITNNVFMEGWGGTNGPWLTFSNNLFVVPPTYNNGYVAQGNMTDVYALGSATITNPHFINLNISTDMTMDGFIFETLSTAGDGDCFLPTAITATITIQNSIALHNSGGIASCVFGSMDGGANLHMAFLKNTIAIGGSGAELGSIRYGETYAGMAGMISALKSNLFWDNATASSYKLYSSGSAVLDVVTGANADYNGGLSTQFLAGSAGKGYNSTFTVPPGAHDLNANASFVDSARNLAKWDLSLGGPGTAANALAQLQLRNTSSWNPAYNIAALLAYVRTGFAPTNGAFGTAGHDGGRIGAVDPVLGPLPNLGYGSANAGYNWFGPKVVYPGFSAYYQFSGTSWRVPVTCAPIGNTCDAAGSGYTPLGTEVNVYVTAATPPTGMDTMLEGTLAPYDICNVSGTTFKLCQHGTATIQTFTSTGTSVSILLDNATVGNSSNTYITSNTGWPAGTTFLWSYGTLTAFTSGNGNVENYMHAETMILKATFPSSATPGDYPVTIVSCATDTTGGGCAGLNDPISFTVTVTPLTYLSDANEATSFPAVSGLSTWVTYMTSAVGAGGGGDWCNSTTGVTTPTDQTANISSGSEAQYYDGGLNYSRVALWAGNTGWKKCTQNILQQIGWGNSQSIAFPNGYVIGNNGSTQGFQVFPIGYETGVSQDPRYISVVQYYAGLIGSGGGVAYVRDGCKDVTDQRIRENAYALDVMLSIQRMGLTPTSDPAGIDPILTWAARRQRCADTLIGNLTSYLDGTLRYAENQYFFDGLTIDALIHWWQLTKDPRVPIVVKGLADQYYSNYNLSAHIAMWNPDASGTPRCNNTPPWFNPDADGHCQDNTTPTITQLHNLFSHAFAWYWRISGDDTYRTEGDEVFSHAFDGQDGFKGKTWSQLYRYSFNYVGWRQGWLSPEKAVE